MSQLIGDVSGQYSTWGTLRRPLRETGSAVTFEQHSMEYLTGFAFHAGFKSTAGNLLRGSIYTYSAVVEFATGGGGNIYFTSNFFTGTGGNTENSLDESHALALVGQTLTLDGGTTFTITADYKDTLVGQLYSGPVPPNPAPRSFDIDEIGLMTSFDS